MEKISCKEIEKLIVRYVNGARKNRGISLIKTNIGLRKVARRHSVNMADSHHIWHGKGVHLAQTHVSSKGFFETIYLLFFTSKIAGENVAMMLLGKVKGIKKTLRTSKDIAWQLHKCWMNSPGHKKNNLNSNFTRIGVGVKCKYKKFYATELFYG